MPGEMLDQDAVKRSIEPQIARWTMTGGFFAVRIDVESAEPLRQVEVTCVVPHGQSRPMHHASTYSILGPFRTRPPPGSRRS